LPAGDVTEGRTVGKYVKANQGDSIPSLAKDHGFRDWATLWNHPSNASLREERKNPNVLDEGDLVFIPTKTPRRVTCSTGKEHVFRVRSRKTHVSVALRDDEDAPYASCEYKLVVEGGQTFSGYTTLKGVVKHEVPADADKADLTLWPDEDDPDHKVEYTLHIGHLDPIGTLDGVRHALGNLGYDCGDEKGDDLGKKTAAALLAFQREEGMDEPTGALDDDTRRRLAARAHLREG
jgi:hypothetical protein